MARHRAGGSRHAVVVLLLALALGCSDDSADAAMPGPGSGPEGSLPAVVIDASMDASIGSLPDGAPLGTVGRDAAEPSPWLHCESTADDIDGGVEPYEDHCTIDEAHGVFVDPERGDDATADGSRDRPQATLAAAIARAVNDGKSVYACAGEYLEPMQIGTELGDGLRVYGGLSCETFLPDDSARSVVRVEGRGAALTIADTRDVRVAHFELENVPAPSPQPGTTYMGAYVENALGVRLEDVRLHAADGEDGADGEEADAAAGDGPDGLAGGDACSGSENLGPLAVSNLECSLAFVNGGQGGDGALGAGDGGNGGWLGGATGGLGEKDLAWSCEPGVGSGIDQMASFDGRFGAGARGFGALLSGRFNGFAGQRGIDGQPGRGGAGGGGARAPASCPGSSQATGAAGGGGGAGGCGGKGGEGGRPGGSSLALVLMNAEVRMQGGALEYGDGGDGGDGAMGQLGGTGGAGAAGGEGSGGSANACRGANGGDGARGGPGGGGAGGHSIGVLHVGEPPRLIDVSGEAQAVDRRGGAGGAAPAEADIDPSIQTTVVGSEGVSEFMHSF